MSFINIKVKTGIYFILVLSLYFWGCQGIGPVSSGDAADELIYLTPGDQMQLDTGDMVYVDSDGMLRGIAGYSIPAANQKLRDVMQALQQHTIFETYKIVSYGPRNIEVGGMVGYNGKIPYPLHEDWSIMNLLMNIEGINATSETRQYLLIRKAWQSPQANLFIRGESIPMLEGMGGDDLLIFPGDTILFPGNENLVYVFGAVSNPLCFTFENNSPPSLEDAVQKAGGFLKAANLKNIEVYRILRRENKSIFYLVWEKEQKFPLQSWDVIFIPFLLPAK